MSATFVNIGRKRGEFERAAKKLVQAHAGVKHPRDLGFIGQADLADRMAAAMMKCNGMVKEGRLQNGVPDEKWARAVAENPLPKLDPEKLWIFLPERRELQIRGGHVVPEIGGQVFPFCHPELFAALGNGYRLTVHFDPAEPTLGAAILNNEAPESSKNSEAWRIGEVLGLADYMGFAPQFAAHASFNPTTEARKKFNRFVATAYRGTGLFGAGAGKADSMRDGAGRVAEIERRGGSAAGPARDAGAAVVENPLAIRGEEVARRRNAANPFAPASQESFARKSSLTARLKAASRAVNGELVEA
ncbi:MAG: hypothetical protein U1G08_17800 [Verrucomicrobiota bacterium]